MQADFVSGLMLYFVFLYSTVIHEAGHAWAALKLGDDTAYRGGQVSLDPIPHMKREPFGMILIPLITLFLNISRGSLGIMGWASAPYNPDWAMQYPRKSALMALAGPAGNLMLILIAALLIRLGYHFEWFVRPDSMGFGTVVAAAEGNRFLEFAAMLLALTFSMNVLLMTLNLLPLPPFDGSAILMLFMNRRTSEAYQQMMWNPGFQLIGLVIAFQAFGIILGNVHSAAAMILYPAA